MSEQFIKKNIRTPIYEYKETTWVYNNLPTFENDTYALFDDKFPVTPGHVLFVPKIITLNVLLKHMAKPINTDWIL